MSVLRVQPGITVEMSYYFITIMEKKNAYCDILN